MLRWPLVLAFALATAVVGRTAEPKDLADLFPAGTLAYAEMGNPAATSDALAAFLKGTPLAEPLAHSHDRRDAMRTPEALPGSAAAGELGLLASPEMLADFKKLGGIAAGLTGFDVKTGRPAVAVAFVLGDSAALGLLARHYLLTSPNIRRVGKIDGIAVYQNRGLTAATPDENGKPVPVEDPVPPQGAGETTYLIAPGLLVIGSDVPAVGDVYRRFAGTEKSPGLASTKLLKPHAEARRKPGLFFAVAAGALDSQFSAAKKVSAADWHKSEAVALVRFALDPKQIDSLSGSFRLEPDGWSLSASAEVKVGGACPLLALLSGGSVSAEDRRGVPADARGILTLALPPKEKRSKAILDAADAIGAALGRAWALPSELAAESEKAGFKLASEFLPTIHSATFVFPKIPAGKKVDAPRPILILTLDDAAAANAWLGAVPKLSRSIAGADKISEPASETIREVKVWGLVHAPGLSIHYAQSETRLIVGRDRDAVADAAKRSAAPGAKSDRPSAALGQVPFHVLAESIAEIRTRSEPRDAEERIRKLETLDDLRNPGEAGAFPKAQRELAKAIAAMPPVQLRANGSGRTLTLRIEQRELDKPLAKCLEALWQWFEAAPQPPELPRILRGRSGATRDKFIVKYH